MVEAYGEPLDGVPLRLYLDHRQGDYPDAVVVSQATIAFANGVKELAYLLDPTLDFKFAIRPSAEGSYWQNTYLRAREEYEKRRRLYQLAIASMIWFVQPPLERIREELWKPFLDKYLPEVPAEKREEEARAIDRVTASPVAEKERQAAFRALDRDTAIVGTGVNIERVRPPLIVPQADFARYSGREESVSTELDRTTVGPLHVVLISPVLDVGNRRWKFATAQGEFGATVRDRAFLERTMRGQAGVPMRSGIEMDVMLETRERLIDGVWQIVDRNVVEVQSVRAPAPDRQGSMFPEDGG